MKFRLMMPGVVVLCENVEMNYMSCGCGEGTEINVCRSSVYLTEMDGRWL